MFEEVGRDFEECLQTKYDVSDCLENLRNILKKKRTQYEPVRTKIRQFVHLLEKRNLYKEEKDFVHAVILYFPTGELQKFRSSAATEVINAVDKILDGTEDEYEELRYMDDQMKLTSLIQAIKDTIDRQKFGWQFVCDEFAKLKVKIASL